MKLQDKRGESKDKSIVVISKIITEDSSELITVALIK